MAVTGPGRERAVFLSGQAAGRGDGETVFLSYATAQD